ncbi:DUF6124 family protein [Pseudomonas kitaguniensis]
MAFEIDGNPRSVALGICRMLAGIQLLVEQTACQIEIAVPK